MLFRVLMILKNPFLDSCACVSSLMVVKAVLTGIVPPDIRERVQEEVLLRDSMGDFEVLFDILVELTPALEKRGRHKKASGVSRSRRRPREGRWRGRVEGGDAGQSRGRCGRGESAALGRGGRSGKDYRWERGESGRGGLMTRKDGEGTKPT